MNAEITGIGGIFIKVEKPEATREWYRSILGIELGEYGGVFDPKHPDNGDAYINFSFFPKNTDYFQPSSHELMLNFRVNHLKQFVALLKEKGVEPLDEIAEYEYGNFIHILDCNGIKIELWEPKTPEDNNFFSPINPNR